jgi:threonine dehydrogenase-like Zn-dependent dehydrogenase
VRWNKFTFAGPGAQPVIHTVPWPKISSKAALIKIGACGVCGTDLHILKGHFTGRSNFPGRSRCPNTGSELVDCFSGFSREG